MKTKAHSNYEASVLKYLKQNPYPKPSIQSSAGVAKSLNEIRNIYYTINLIEKNSTK